MKRIISFILVFASLFTVLAFAGSSAEAASYTAFFYEQHQQFNCNDLTSGYTGIEDGGPAFYGNSLCYMDYHNFGICVRNSLNGKTKKVASIPRALRHGVVEYTVYKNYFYYTDYFGGYLYKCALNGKYHKAIRKISSVRDDSLGVSLIAANNKLVICVVDHEGTENNSGLFICDLNGKNYKRITADKTRDAYSWGSNLYFINDTLKKLMCYNFKTQKMYAVYNTACIDDRVGTIGMDGKYYYVSKSINKYSSLETEIIYRIDTAKRTAKIIAKWPGIFVAVGGGKLYAVYGESVYKFNAKKGTFALLRRFPANTTLVKPCFYKNKLIVEKWVTDVRSHKFYIVDTV